MREGGKEGYVEKAGNSIEVLYPFFEDGFCGRARENTVKFVTQNLDWLAMGAPSVGIV